MPYRTMSTIKERKASQARAAKAGRAAAEARGAPAKKKKVVTKPSEPKKKAARRAPTPAQKVRSISGGGSRTDKIKDLQRQIRELEGGK